MPRVFTQFNYSGFGESPRFVTDIGDGVKAGEAGPSLWDGRLNEDGDPEVYLGEAGLQVVISGDGSTGYTLSVSGWQAISEAPGDYYLTYTEGAENAVFGSATPPDYPGGVYGVLIGSVSDGVWQKRYVGKYQLPVPPGDADNLVLLWDVASGWWKKSPYKEVEEAVVQIRLNEETDPHRLEYKRGTVLAKDVDENWSTLLTPTGYND